MPKKPNDIKAFSFLYLDPRAVADQLRRAGWDRDEVVYSTGRVIQWARAVRDAFCAAEEAGRDDT